MLSFVGKHTNYQKLSLLPLVVKPWQNFEKKIGIKFWILLLLLQISYIFIASTKDLNVLQVGTENSTFATRFTLLYKPGNV